MTKGSLRGFTLIELSIVLVIVGLVVRGALVGQSLVSAAAVRAQITQLEKFNAATNTFYEKYGGLPGDLLAASVTQFGFHVVPTRAGTRALGNADGLVDGCNFSGSACGVYHINHTNGENAWFWEDLSSNAGMIEGGFSTATSTNLGNHCVGGALIGTCIDQIIPRAKIGNNNYVVLNNDGANNYFTLSAIYQLGYAVGDTYANVGVTVQQAYAIDAKVDDGLPQSGRVTAKYSSLTLNGSNFSGAAGGGVAGASPGTVANPSATTCFDDSGNASIPMTYSLSQNSGSGVNCALSFRIQAGD